MSQKDRNQLKPPFIMIFRGDMIICMIVPSPSAVSEHVPMPGQTEWCQRNKDQITLHTGGSRGAPTLLFITSSVSTYVYSCTYNGCQFLPFAPTPVFWGFTIFFFSQKSESRFWLRIALMQKNTQVKEHLRRQVGGLPGAGVQACLRKAYVLHWVVPFLCHVDEFECWSPELWELDYTDATADISSSRVRCSFWRIINDKTANGELSYTSTFQWITWNALVESWMVWVRLWNEDEIT